MKASSVSARSRNWSRSAPNQQVSSYYLNLKPQDAQNGKAVRIAVKNFLARTRDRIDSLDVQPAVRQALRQIVEDLVPTIIGERHTLGLACFVASDSGYAWAMRLPWPVRDRAFFEDRFVLWPLQQILDQADRYAICLTDKDDARLFLMYMEQIAEVSDIFDEIPGRIRFPDPFGELGYMHKHIEHVHRHFEKVAEAAFRLFRREPFEQLIIGGLWETLPQFESRLHRYLRDRIVSRWDIDVFTSTQQIFERAQQEEQQVLHREAQGIWKAIQEQRPQRGAVGRKGIRRTLAAAGRGVAHRARCEVAGLPLLDLRPAAYAWRPLQRVHWHDRRDSQCR